MTHFRMELLNLNQPTQVEFSPVGAMLLLEASLSIDMPSNSIAKIVVRWIDDSLWTVRVLMINPIHVDLHGSTELLIITATALPLPSLRNQKQPPNQQHISRQYVNNNQRTGKKLFLTNTLRLQVIRHGALL